MISQLNEDSSLMWNSQVFFALTEAALSYVQLQTANRGMNPSKHKGVIVTLFTLSLLHLVISLPEKMLWGLVGLGGAQERRNVVRDVFLTFGDIGSLAWALLLWFDAPSSGKLVHSGTLPRRRGMRELLAASLPLFLCLYTVYQGLCVF